MNGANHAATALVIRKVWPEVPVLPLILATLACDLLWAPLVLLGVELVRYQDPVRSLADILMVYMPWSHSVLSGMLGLIGAFLLTWGITRKRGVAIAIGLGVLSHIVLDIMVHNHDVAITWSTDSPKLGSGLYGIPPWALLVEMTYMVGCWWYAGASRRVLYWLIALNATVITLYIPALSGPQEWFTQHYWLFPVLVLVNALMSAGVLWWLLSKQ